MPFDNQVDPNELFMSIREAMAATGLDRNQLRSAIIKKQLSHELFAGNIVFYRASVLQYVDKYGKKEVQHA